MMTRSISSSFRESTHEKNRKRLKDINDRAIIIVILSHWLLFSFSNNHILFTLIFSVLYTPMIQWRWHQFHRHRHRPATTLLQIINLILWWALYLELIYLISGLEIHFKIHINLKLRSLKIQFQIFSHILFLDLLSLFINKYPVFLVILR
jgi:hypothetical protein